MVSSAVIEFQRLHKSYEVGGHPVAALHPLDLSIVFKSLDLNGDKMLSVEEFKGVIGAIYPNGKK